MHDLEIDFEKSQKLESRGRRGDLKGVLPSGVPDLVIFGQSMILVYKIGAQRIPK